MTAEKPNTYSSEVRTTEQGEPHECPRCGESEHHPYPARLVYRHPASKTTNGSFVIDCPRCDIFTVENTPGKADNEQLKHDVYSMLNEDKRRGKKGGGSSKGPSRKKPVKRSKTARPEQEPAAFCNGRAGGDIVVTTRLEKAERKKVMLTLDTKADLQIASHRDRKNMAIIMRNSITAANIAAQHRIDPYDAEEQTVPMQVYLYPTELDLLAEAQEAYGVNRSEVIGCILAAHLAELERKHRKNLA